VRGLEDLDPADQIAILKRTFADVGGAAPRILAQLDAGAPLYFSAVGQVSTPAWSKGRIALLGDAAFCNATFGGGGTSLALIGAYVLAAELGRTDDHRAALTGYEASMRPFVDATPPVRMACCAAPIPVPAPVSERCTQAHGSSQALPATPP